MLHDEQPGRLKNKSIKLVEGILDRPGAKLITHPTAKPFRNTLVHYNLDTRIDATGVDVTKPLFGLVSACFPSYDVIEFRELLDNCIEETVAALNEWATE
jgi:hypothetical protein